MENSVYGIVYSSNELAQVTTVEELVGKKLNSIASNSTGVIAAGTDGYYVVTEYEVVSFKHINFEHVAAGKGFLVGVENKSRVLYTWGHGSDGQLGQGVCKTLLTDPCPVNYKAEFATIACGDAFTVALDRNGNTYSWGENYSRQLGLYTKKQSDMSIKNSVIEDIIFAPRLMPFSLAHPVKKVACGPNFAAAVTKNGEVYAWGAGECGQLGYGRCTRQEIPTKVPLFDESSGLSVSVVDVACGAGHTLAVAENGSLYRWGLNKSGQLGLGDTNTRYSPVGRRESSSFRKVIAEGHSSAAIDEEGRLYCWGSNDFGRLMHLEEKTQEVEVALDEAENIINVEFPGPPKKKFIPTYWEPRLVEHKSFHSCVVSNFAFSKTGSAAFVPTTVTQTIPSSGPKRTFSQLRILGYGLWNSPTIIVKFSSKVYSAYNPPRSCTGTWSASSLGDCSGIISCKPPKFAECGTYCVSVSMDGANFLPQILEIEVYPELSVVAQSPDLLDIRQCGPNSNQPPLTLRVSGLDASASASPASTEFFVKMSFFDMSVNDDRDYKTRKASPLSPALEILTKGRLVPDTEPAEVPLDENGEPVPVKEVVGTILCEPFDTSFLQDSSCTYEMKCRISRNEQDYSVIAVEKNPGMAAAASAPALLDPATGAPSALTAGAGAAGAAAAVSAVGSTIYHCFTPAAQQPSCCYCTDPLEKYLIDTKDDEYVRKNATLAFEREVTIVGSSFLPSAKLPKGCSIEAHLTLPCQDPATAGSEDEEPAATEPPVILPVVCDSINSLRFTLQYANVTHFFQTMTGRGLTELSINVDLCLKKAATKDLSVLSKGQVTFTLFKNQAISVNPNCFKHTPPSAVATAPVVAEAPAESEEHPPAATPPLVNVVSITKKDGSPYSFVSPTAVVRMHFPASAGREPVVLTDVTMVPVPVDPPVLEAAASAEEGGELAEVVDPMGSTASAASAAPTQFTIQAALGPSDPSVDLVYLSVSMDGSAPVPAEDTWAKVYFYSNLAKYSVTPAAVPKGGFPAGTSITLVLEKFCPACPAGQCVVRVRGSSPAVFVDVPASMTGDTQSSITFAVPEAAKLAGMDPVMNAKDKLYFVEVSIDGGASFDSPDSPQLQLK